MKSFQESTFIKIPIKSKALLDLDFASCFPKFFKGILIPTKQETSQNRKIAVLSRVNLCFLLLSIWG